MLLPGVRQLDSHIPGELLYAVAVASVTAVWSEVKSRRKH